MKVQLVTELKESFVDTPWSSPESELEVGDYCSVCLVDENPKGAEKKKGLCHLPIRSKPGAPVNKAALRAVSGVLGGARTGKSFSMPSDALATFKRLYKAAFGKDYGKQD